MTTSIRFSDEEMIAISAAADRKQKSRHEFMRQAILTAANPATPPKAPENPKPEPTKTSRNSTAVSMGSLATFYGK